MKKLLLSLIVLMNCSVAVAQNRWEINNSGGITWNVAPFDSHYDHIEMAGEKVATVLRWGVKPSGEFSLERSMIFPMLRTIPNNTHASLMQRFAADIPSMLIINGRSLNQERVEQVTIDGKLNVLSSFASATHDVGVKVQPKATAIVQIRREIAPSTTKAMLCEKYVVKNITNKPMIVLVPSMNVIYNTPSEKGVEGSYTMVQKLTNSGTYDINPKDSIIFYSYIEAYSKNENPTAVVDIDNELNERATFVKHIWNNLDLKTPDHNINRMFAFAKIRASESIYKTKGGYMHGPGGESYYAAIWANDQAEYINPFFPFLGYNKGNESAINSYRHFARFMNDEYKPIPSSIIAEGLDVWAGAGDRGDAAMVAYGASRYALTMASKQEAEELWPLIEWCLEYCNRKINKEGVVLSDADELEGRFPAGDANLCTSTLYYDALLSSVYLAKELKKSSAQQSKYKRQAALLRSNIERYFGANVEGFNTYQYYKGNDILRSWICMPLTVGIYDRADQTIKAIFSDRLWTENGLLTQAGTSTFWDRSTLYALRGVYSAGKPDVATDFLKRYSEARLLGNHVPYAIEAYPEGGQRHLSAESALYCRIFIEGLFGIRPTGFNSFSLSPQLPKEWNEIELSNVNGFGKVFDLKIERIKGSKYKITLSDKNKSSKIFEIKENTNCNIVL